MGFYTLKEKELLVIHAPKQVVTFQCIDGKYLNDMLPKGKMGHYVPIIRHEEIKSRLLFLIKLIQEPIKDIPEETVIMTERKKFYKHIETAFKDILPKSFEQFYEEYK